MSDTPAHKEDMARDTRQRIDDAPKSMQRADVDWMKRATDAADAHDAYIATLAARIAKLETKVDDDYGINFENARTAVDCLAPMLKRIDALQAAFDEVVKSSLHSIQAKVNGVIDGGFIEKTAHEKRVQDLLESNTKLHNRVVELRNSSNEASDLCMRRVEEIGDYITKLARMTHMLADEKKAHAATKRELDTEKKAHTITKRILATERSGGARLDFKGN